MVKNSQNGEHPKRLSALDRAILTAVGKGRTVGREDDPARESYPELWQWMTRTGDEGDHVFQPASLSIQLGPEGVLVSLTHRDLGVSCSISCLNLADVLPALEQALTQANTPIRNWGKTEPKLRKRRS